MRCGPARKMISDELDGALAPRRRPRLDAHLNTCPACRGYRTELGRIQQAVGRAAEPAAAYWRGFEGRLEAKIAAAEAGRGPVRPPFAIRRRLAWTAAAVLALAGVAFWYGLLRQGTAPAEVWSAYEDVLDPFILAAESSPELAGRMDGEIKVSIEELVPVPDAEAAVLPAADPLFWESLSDDDLRAIVAGLEEGSGQGGPR